MHLSQLHAPLWFVVLQFAVCRCRQPPGSLLPVSGKCTLQYRSIHINVAGKSYIQIPDPRSFSISTTIIHHSPSTLVEHYHTSKRTTAPSTTRTATTNDGVIRSRNGPVITTSKMVMGIRRRHHEEDIIIPPNIQMNQHQNCQIQRIPKHPLPHHHHHHHHHHRGNCK